MHEWLARIKKRLSFTPIKIQDLREETSEWATLQGTQTHHNPEKLHNRTHQTIHDDHFSVEKMQLRDKESVFWPKVSADILQTAQSCKMCQTSSIWDTSL